MMFQDGTTALYMPSVTPGGSGTWEAGPVVPGGLGMKEASAAVMTNGHVLFTAGAIGADSPVHFFEFDPTVPIDSSLTDVTPAISLSTPSQPFVINMLLLPTGQVLVELPVQGVGPAPMYVYTPDGAPQAAWKPTITSVVASGSHYTLTGTQLNGLSEGASYGGDLNEMATNYPIIELKNAAGKVYFARTFNWSSTGVATGSLPVSTDFSLPANMPFGTYSLSVVANGIASDPVSFTGGVVGPSADLAVTNIGPSTCTEGNFIIYNLSVTNNGPSTATNVVLTDTLDANLNYSSASKSKGSVTHSGSVVTFNFGSVAAGQTVTATVTAQSTEDGNLTTTAVVASNVSDANLLNNTAAATVAVAEPPIVVSNPVTVSGKNQHNVQVATFTHANGLEPASAFVATINWGDGTISSGAISLSRSGTYSVQGSHTYASGGSHTVTTTVAESESGGSMHALAVMSTDNASSTSISDPPAAVQSTTTDNTDVHSTLKTIAVDQVYGASTVSRSRRALHTIVDEAEIDDLFAVI
jgi:uncharacterized repeat protein (TIGR01451 family)